jgi:hypothetical protein
MQEKKKTREKFNIKEANTSGKCQTLVSAASPGSVVLHVIRNRSEKGEATPHNGRATFQSHTKLSIERIFIYIQYIYIYMSVCTVNSRGESNLIIKYEFNFTVA